MSERGGEFLVQSTVEFLIEIASGRAAGCAAVPRELFMSAATHPSAAVAAASFDSQAPRLAHVNCISPSGLHRMAYAEWGDPANARVLVCAHGLTRTGRDFDVLARKLAGRYRVVCPDVVGRGRSDWLDNPSQYALAQYVSDMVTLIARLNVDTVDWFGTSMGGMIGMVLAGLPNSPVRKLLLNDIGPRLDAAALQRIGDYAGKPVRFATEQQAYDYIASISLGFGPHTPDEWQALNRPLLRQRNGGWELHYDPRIAVPFNASTAELADAGQALLWRAFVAFPGPTLVVRGAQSDLLSSETVAQMVERGKQVTSVEIAGVGHAPTFVHDDQIGIAEAFFDNDAPPAVTHQPSSTLQ
jgi:pimeloyl-ACP methyl ester carboxylesterase